MKAASLVFILVLFLFCPRFVRDGLAQTADQNHSQEDADVRLIASSETSVMLEFRPSWRHVRQETIDGQTYTSFAFDLSESAPENAGLPMIPYRSLPVLVGSDQTPRIEILAAESEPTTGINLLPVPSPDRKTTRLTYKASQNYHAFRFETLADASQIHHVRGYRVSYIRFYPLSYDATTKTVRKYSRIQIRVSFGRFDAASAAQTKLVVQKDEPFVSGILNYQTAKTWRKAAAGAVVTRTFAATQSVLGTGRFYKLVCTEEGLYKLDKAYLETIGIDIGTIDPRKIKIYYNGGEELPTALDAQRISELRECAVYVEGQTDGSFDAGDYVLFYIKAARGVKYDVPKYPPSTSPGTDTSPRLTHYLNRQTAEVHAFLSLDGDDGKRLTVNSSSNEASPFVPQSFRTQAFLENEQVNFSGSGTDFFSLPLTTNLRNFAYQIPLPGIDKTKTVYYRAKAVSTGQRDLVRLLEDGRVIASVYTGYQGATDFQEGEYWFATASLSGSTITGETSQFEWSFSPSSSSARIYPDWVELDYYRKFEASAGFLKFNSLLDLTNSSTVEYRITNFSSLPQVWDITDIASIKLVSQKEQLQGTAVIQVQEQPGVFHEYIAFSPDVPFKQPVSASPVENQNLRWLAGSLNPQGAPDYIIIYPPEFRAEAERLLAYRTDAATWGSFALRGVAVDVGKIYNEFSGGRQDFTAIRDFIRYLYDNSSSSDLVPKYVLLFGDGDWDMRNIAGNIYPEIPAYQSDEVLQTVVPVTTSDDFFVSVSGDFIPGEMTPDLAIGRLAVRSVQEAKIAVDKIISYETGNLSGAWRNRVALVADDGTNGTRSDGSQFSDDSENTVSALPEYLQPVKIYSAFYKQESVSGGRRRPGAYNEIINQINRGALALNFIGHGNPYIWTEEQIFNPATSLPLLKNSDRLTIGVTATCDFARFDDPAVQSGAEKMVVLPDAGAVAMLSTARSIFISSGSAYPPLLFRELFRRDTDGQLSRLGTGFMRFKTGRGGAADATKFMLLGDPALQIGAGQAVASVDSINGKAVSSERLRLKALGQVRVAGTIRNAAGAVASGFNGTASVEIFDAPRKVGADHEGTGTFDSYYDVQNSIIFKSSVPVKNGKFQFGFFVPKDIRYDSTRTGKIQLYAWSSQLSPSDPAATASGAASGFILSGTDTTATTDTDGPIVDLYLNDKSFRSGNITDENPLFVAEISDRSGINLTQGTGHAMMLVLDENEQTAVTVSDFFEAEQGNFSGGEVRYRLQNLSEGRYTVRFKVWDTWNNLTEQLLDFTVESSSGLTIGNVFNFPNPFNPSSERTVFIFPHNRAGDNIEVKIRIYTVAGRLIRTLRETIYDAPSQIRIEWDGRDEDGSGLANGIYLYKLVARSLNGDFETQLLQKLAIVR